MAISAVSGFNYNTAFMGAERCRNVSPLQRAYEAAAIAAAISTPAAVTTAAVAPILLSPTAVYAQQGQGLQIGKSVTFEDAKSYITVRLDNSRGGNTTFDGMTLQLEDKETGFYINGPVTRFNNGPEGKYAIMTNPFFGETRLYKGKNDGPAADPAIDYIERAINCGCNNYNIPITFKGK